jgi:hypothetical protein
LRLQMASSFSPKRSGLRITLALALVLLTLNFVTPFRSSAFGSYSISITGDVCNTNGPNGDLTAGGSSPIWVCSVNISDSVFGVDSITLSVSVSGPGDLGASLSKTSVTLTCFVTPCSYPDVSTLSFDATNTISGTYTVTVSGTGGSTGPASTTEQVYDWKICAPSGYTCSSSPPPLVISPGKSGSIKVTGFSLYPCTPQGCETEPSQTPVDLSALCAGINCLDFGITAAFSPSSFYIDCLPLCTSTLTLSVPADESPGNYPVTIHGKMGGITHSFPLTLTVATQEVTMTLSYSVVGGGAPTAPVFNYVQNGVSKSLTLGTVATGLSVDAGSSWSVTPNPLGGSSSTQRWYSSQPLTGTASTTTIVFSFQHQYSVTFAVSPTTGGTTSPKTGWFNAGSTISITAIQNSGYKFSSWSSSTASITIKSSSLASTSATIGGTGTITARFIPTVILSLSPTSGSVLPGKSIGTIATIKGGTQLVKLTVVGILPTGVTITFGTNPIADKPAGVTDPVTIHTSLTTRLGTYTIIIKATGANGQTSTATFTMKVT